MDIKKFVLSYYENATSTFYISEITAPTEACNLHTHDYFQVYYMLSGKITHHIESGSAELSCGDVFIVPPNLPHYIDTNNGPVDFYAMSFMPDFFLGMSENNKLISDFLYYLKTATLENIQPKFTLPHEDIIFVDTVFKRIMSEFKSTKTGKEEVIKECVSVLLSLFARVYFEEKAEALTLEYNRNSVLHCIEYIKNHLDEDITLTEIARRSAMSKTCFCSIFSSITGTSFKQFLNSCRIKKAAELILAGEKISNVSILCGYNDLSTFYRNFKKQIGISPTQYQKKR